MAQSTSVAIERAFEKRIQLVRERISDAARRSGRAAESISLVAVSKTVDRAMVDLAYSLGLREFGENRVQDAVAKFEHDVPNDLLLHMIGGLQTNKVNQVIGRFTLVHSLDRESLATALDKRARREGIVQPVLIQVNVGREEQKHGCSVDDIAQLVDLVARCEGLRLDGFMTMAPLVSTPEEARPVFAEMQEIAMAMRQQYRELSLPHISMGMTDDFEVAIEEGATIVRVGRALFQDSVAT